MYSWLMGRVDDDADDEKEVVEKTEENEDLEDTLPPPVLKREKGYYTECKKIDVIRWKNYDEEFKKIDEELKQMRETLADLDVIVKKTQKNNEELDKLTDEWNNRLSPPELTRCITTNKKKRSKTKKKKNNA